MLSRPFSFRIHIALVLSLSSCIAVAESPRLPAASHPPTAPAHPAGLYDRVASPRAEVKAGDARFTVLTPQLIRMEWAASIAQTPVYVQSGTILPMAPPMETSNAKPLDPLILTVFHMKDGDRGSYTLYEDAGNTRAYEANQAKRTPISAEQRGAVTEVTIAEGSYPGMVLRRGYELTFARGTGRRGM